MSDYAGGGSNYNRWDLKELEYNGELYHYTKVAASRGIFCHKDCPDYPENCISLRFTRIDCMTKNDPDERMHIDKAVKKIAQKLSRHGKICDGFLKIICDYKPTSKGFYWLAQDKIDNQFYKPQHRVLSDFGPVDYYVACFSTNPNNEHIVEEFKTSVCIAFNPQFSLICTDLFSHVPAKVGLGFIPDLGSDTYPVESIRKCFLHTYLRRVEYIDTSADVNEIKSDLIEKRLLDIFECYKEEPTAGKIWEDVEDMYSLCDAFIKDIRYQPEEEVRFVIRLPQREYFLKKYGQFPQLLADSHFVFDKDRTYLQLPISDEFVTL